MNVEKGRMGIQRRHIRKQIILFYKHLNISTLGKKNHSCLIK